jgi:hypothetical protein
MVFGTIRSGNKDRLLEAASTPEYRTIVSSLGIGKDEYHVGAMTPKCLLPEGKFPAIGRSMRKDNVRSRNFTNTAYTQARLPFGFLRGIEDQ